MAIFKEEIKPQPIAPPVSCYWGFNDWIEEYMWFVQVPITKGGITFNEPTFFENTPNGKGELYKDKMIKKVSIIFENKKYYWEVTTAT